MAKKKNNSHKATLSKKIIGKLKSYWKKYWPWVVVVLSLLGGLGSIITIKIYFLDDEKPSQVINNNYGNFDLLKPFLNNDIFDTVKVIGVKKLSKRDSIFNEGMKNFQIGNTELAFKEFQKTLIIDTLQNDSSNLLYVYACLGATKVYNSSLDTVLYYFKIANSYKENSDSMIYLCELYNYWGLTYGHFKKYDSALYYLNSAERISSDKGYLDVRANIKGNLGALYYLKGNYTKSKNALEEALPIYRSENDSLNMQKTLEQLSDVLIKLESYLNAQIKLKEALQIAVSLGNESEQARLYLKLVKLKKIPVKIKFSK